ncbi:MAG: ABC transporter ATP-binding protein [Clostridia bacterium]|nr:ABC transporter ATP-binding protein [Clostridia bacterium]
MNEIVLSAEGLEKSFGQHRVLKGIDLSIRRGEIFGLIGPSGAGKTTLIRILTGQLPADQGRASILGESTAALSDRFYRSIGVVFDSLGLLERLTCQQNLSVFARIHSIPNARIHQALSAVGLQDAAKCKACYLSRGMRQRLAIARAVLHNPQILFLDEPTSGLDPVNTEGIHRLIRAQRDRGATVFLTTHRMDEAMKLCDRILLLNQGAVAEQGTPAEICSRYQMNSCIRILCRDGTEQILPIGPAGAETLGRLMQEDAIETLHTTEPNLEDVFLQIAKRKEMPPCE